MRLSDIGAWYGRVAAALLVLWCAASVAASTPDRSDVRILIDISGSMRQNDPNNLRRPALRMLAGLLQPGTKAGVWTFARWTDNLVPVGDVDSAWKKRTQSVSEKISSPGQFTNIEDVLDKSSADWSGEPTTHARHLVLLTDGMVDVSKQAAENAQSRERIIGTLLPRLKAAGVKVHTIALSERADHALMKTLAGETGGWYQQVAQADELQRAFLRMFETVGKPDSVPLQDNRFVVDSSISEATVLVFSKPDAPPVVLRSPSRFRAAAMRRICSRPVSRAVRSPVHRSAARCRLSMSWSRCAEKCTAAASSASASTATSTAASPFARC